MLDENEFLSPYGLRSLSRIHADHPYVMHVGGQEYRVSYLPAESDTGMFGGNSNWRGPIWMPVNALIIRALQQFYLYYGDNFKVECPTGSGKMMNLFEVSKEIGEPSAGEFQRVVAEIRLGRPIDDAMTAMAVRVGSDDLKWAVIAINVQRQVGGNLAEVLDIVAATVRERAYIRRQVNVLSAEGRISVAILACLPIGIMLYIAVVNAEYIKPLFTTTPGLVMLIGGALWMGLGIFIMTRMIKIDV